MSEAKGDEQSWWVYMIRTQKDRLYTGITKDIERRFRQHKGELKGGAKFFNGDKALAVVYREACADRSEASKREAQIKSLTRQEKLLLLKT